MKHCYQLNYVLDSKEDVGCITYHEKYGTMQAAKERLIQIEEMFKKYFEIYKEIVKIY